MVLFHLVLKFKILGFQLFKFNNTFSGFLSIFHCSSQKAFHLNNDSFLLSNSILVNSDFLHFFVNSLEVCLELVVIDLNVVKLRLHPLRLGKVHVGTFQSFFKILIPDSFRSISLSQFDYFNFQVFVRHTSNFLRDKVL